jgi:hypothetical protein
MNGPGYASEGPSMALKGRDTTAPSKMTRNVSFDEGYNW